MNADPRDVDRSPSGRPAGGGAPAGLFGLVTSSPSARPDSLRAPKVALADVDGSHMGPAVNWWQAAVDGDESVIADIEAAIAPDEALRSAVEVILSMVEWIARNDRESGNDLGVRVLSGLASETLLRPSQRVLCSDLATGLTQDPVRTTFVLHRVDVVPAMRLMVLLSRAIEQRFDVDVPTQIATFRDVVLAAELP